MLASYQLVVKSLLSKDHYPGVSVEELDLFKSQFRTSAYTCRLNACPLAYLGFESEYLRLQHEMGHVQRLQCSFPGCHYPLFGSVKSLRYHVKKHHNSSPIRNSIRKASGIATDQLKNETKSPIAFSEEHSIDESIQDHTLHRALEYQYQDAIAPWEREFANSSALPASQKQISAVDNHVPIPPPRPSTLPHLFPQPPSRRYVSFILSLRILCESCQEVKMLISQPCPPMTTYVLIIKPIH